MKKYLLFLLVTSCFVYAIFDYDLAIVQSQKGNWNEAIQRLKKVLADQPDNSEILYDSGVSAYKNEEFDKALAYFKRSAESASAPQALREQAYFNAGNAHVQLKQLHEAIDAYDKVLAQNPDHEKAKHNKELVKKMLEQQKKEQEQKDNEKEKDKKEENKDDQEQQKDQNKEKDDQKDSADDKSMADKQEKEQKQDQEKKDQQRQEKQKKDQEQQKKEKAQQQEKQKKESADQRQQPQEPKQKNESEQKLSAALEHALKEREKKDAQLNKKMIKAMAESQNGGKNGSNCW